MDLGPQVDPLGQNFDTTDLGSCGNQQVVDDEGYVTRLVGDHPSQRNEFPGLEAFRMIAQLAGEADDRRQRRS